MSDDAKLPLRDEPTRVPPAPIPDNEDGLADYLGRSVMRDADLGGPGLTTLDEPAGSMAELDAAEQGVCADED